METAMNEALVDATIDGVPIRVPTGTTILDAALRAKIHIPTLCKHPDLVASAACGLCVVKLEGSTKMPRACCTQIEPGMRVITHDPEIIEIRRTIVELILASHPNECLTCGRNTDCELQTVIADFGIREEPFPKQLRRLPKDASTGVIVLEPAKCIKCGRCIEVCQDVQDVWALSLLDRGIETRISPAGDISLADSPCVRCGQCSAHCPTGAIVEKDETARVWRALLDSPKHCVVQIAPAVRVTLGEHFGFAPGTNLTKKLYTCLRRLGFEAVFDTNFGADLTIVEEATELVRRLVDGSGALPLITSCCPAWVDYMEKFHADMIEHFSSAKSPHAMVGVLAKTYYAAHRKLDPSNIKVVSVMPCTAKKFEISRSEQMRASGYQDVDVVLTTRELARMVRQSGLDFAALEDGECDSLIGEYSGAGTIFGATGGVMEAALRTAHYLVTKEQLPKLEFTAVRGTTGVKEATVSIAGKELRLAAAHGLANVRRVLAKIRATKEAGEEPAYHFVEVMACPGGCVGGGGQPYGVTDELRRARANGLYGEDSAMPLRCSHDNPHVQQLYSSFLGEPGGAKAHQLLHTAYRARPLYQR